MIKKTVCLGLFMFLLTITACGQSSSISCSNDEVKTVVADIAFEAYIKAVRTRQASYLLIPQAPGEAEAYRLAAEEVVKLRDVVTVENIRTESRDKDTGKCLCAATLGLPAADGSFTTLDITYDVEVLEDKPDDLYITVYGL